MAIKIELKEKDEEKLEYPFIGYVTGLDLIILFTRDCIGTVIDPGTSAHAMGEYREDWNMEKIEKYLGQITLSND